MRRLADYGRDDHPEGDEDRAPAEWIVSLLDDCDTCGDLRVEVTLEEVGRPGTGVGAHLSPSGARRLRAALGRALAELGEPADEA